MDIRNHIPRLHQREEKAVCRHNMCAALTVCVCVCGLCIEVIKCHGAVRYCTWRSWKGLK